MMYKGKKLNQVLFLCVIYILCSFPYKTRPHWMLRKRKLATNKLRMLDNMLRAVVVIHSGFVQLRGTISSILPQRSSKEVIKRSPDF